jgi:4-amino-4-deoxy-L-arabinose transferase-like glycosyltransferase
MTKFIDTLISFAAARHWRALTLLFVLSLGCFLPGFASLQPMDRDEPRFAQASKQMLETGDFVDIRFQTEARHKKPVGIYWLQVAAVSAGQALGVPEARTTIWLYRLPSLVGAIATVLLTYWALLAFLAPRHALLGAALMAATILLGVEARLAKTDAVLAACAVAAMGAMARTWLDWKRVLHFGVHPLNWLVFWGATSLALLIKGPIMPMIWGLALLVLTLRERSFRWFAPLKPGRGLALCAIVVLPWVIAIVLKSGFAFFSESVGKDMLGKVAEGQEKHWGPPGLYLLIFFGTFWPAAPLAAMSLPFAVKKWREPAILFLLAWVVPSWIVFEAVPTKLPHYVLPLYPALAGLTMLALINGALDRRRRGAVATAWLIALIPALLLVGSGAATWIMDRTFAFFGLPVLALALGLAIAAVSAFRRDAVEHALWRGVFAGLVVAIAVFGLTQPALRSLKLSPRLAETVRALPCADPQTVTVGYREPSLVFLVGTDLAMAASGAEAAEFLAGSGCRVALVEARFGPEFAQAVARFASPPRLVTRVAGFNINGGRRLDIGVYLMQN